MDSAKFDPHLYTIKVRKIVEADRQYFVASVDELPDVAAFEPTYVEAYDTVVEAITMLAQTAHEEAREFPAPNISPPDEYSGRITLRLSPRLHARLDVVASGEGVSLNSHIANILTAYSTLNAIFTEADRCRLAAARNSEIFSLGTGLATEVQKLQNFIGGVFDSRRRNLLGMYNFADVETNYAPYQTTTMNPRLDATDEMQLSSGFHRLPASPSAAKVRTQ